MPTYTVREIKNQRPWSKDGGEPTVVYYDFLVEGEDRQINTGRKPTNPLTVGMTIEGTLEPDSRGNGLKFVRANANGFAGQRGKSPEESARITRMHSQEMAIRFAALRIQSDLLPEPFNGTDLKQLISWFDADAKAATP